MVNKLYVLVRGDLTKSQQAVQASHAVAEFMLYTNNISCRCGGCRDQHLWENETIVLLRVKDKDDLDLWLKKIDEVTKTYTEFYEPDLRTGEVTAIAAWGKDLPDLLKDLPLL